jgi:hypothetical protein
MDPAVLKREFGKDLVLWGGGVTAQNPLFPVNLADLLLRHSSANHKRETIAFSKRRQGAMYP